MKTGAEAFDISVKEYFERCCYKKDPISHKLIKDDTDKIFWNEGKKYGTDFLPYALEIEHDMDEYGGYDSHLLKELGFKGCDSIRMNALSFVDSVIR